MAGSVNKMILLGNVGRDPEVRHTQTGMKIVNFRMATSDSWTDRHSGERQERTEWHSVAIINEHLADVAERYLRKGSKVYIEGKIQTRKWTDQSGQDHYTTEVMLGRFGADLVLLDGNRDNAPLTEGQPRSATPPAGGPDAPPAGRGDLDDDIPI